MYIMSTLSYRRCVCMEIWRTCMYESVWTSWMKESVWRLTWVVHVRQFFKARPPVVEVVVVLVTIWAHGGDGAEAACDRAVALIVINQRCVVRWDVQVIVSSVQALLRSSRKGENWISDNLHVCIYLHCIFMVIHSKKFILIVHFI